MKALTKTDDVKIQLIEILNEHNQILTQIIEAEGEVLPDIEKALAATDENKKFYIDSFGKMQKSLEAQIAFWRDEKKSADAKLKFLSNSLQRLKESLSEAMQYHQLKTLEGLRHKFSFIESGYTYDWKDDLSEIDKHHFLESMKSQDFVKTTYALKKDELKKFLETDKLGSQFLAKYFKKKPTTYTKLGLNTPKLEAK